MSDYRYILEKYNGMKTRYRCPNCNKQGVFTRYIDTHTNEHLSHEVGICSRLIKCGYHYTPKQYFEDNNISKPVNTRNFKTPLINKPQPKTSYISNAEMKKSLNSNKANYFIDFLSNHWNREVAIYLVNKYNIGTSIHWEGATIFWQVDIKGRVRSGKIMLYDASNCKRVKKPYNHINWVHKVFKKQDFNLKQCYFGEHLLNKDIDKPVAIVESEKTAIIASVYLPEFTWLACGSVNNLNKEKTKVLKGRNVVLFPDLKCFDLWNNKIPQLSNLATFRVSNLLEEQATLKEREQGLDLADYLLMIK